MKFKAYILVMIFMIGGLSAVGGAKTDETPVLPKDPLLRVEYEVSAWPPLRTAISDSAVLAEILAAVEFVPKEPCECAHVDLLHFVYPDRVIDISICDHCLDYKRHYRMPPPLWQILRQYRPQPADKSQ